MRRARALASSSPSTASPSRLRLSCSPLAAALSSMVLSASDSASRTRCPTSCRMRARASGITIRGAWGPTTPPSPTSALLIGPRKEESYSVVTSLSARAATAWSSGRMTRSTKSIVNFTPCLSRRIPASCSAALSLTPSAALSHARARATAASTQSSRSWDSGSRVCAGVVMAVALPFGEETRAPASEDKEGRKRAASENAAARPESVRSGCRVGWRAETRRPVLQWSYARPMLKKDARRVPTRRVVGHRYGACA